MRILCIAFVSRSRRCGYNLNKLSFSIDKEIRIFLLSSIKLKGGRFWINHLSGNEDTEERERIVLKAQIQAN